MSFYVLGRRQAIVIDDYLPSKIHDINSLVFAERSIVNFNIWASLIEKSFAKLNGNYENLQLGY